MERGKGFYSIVALIVLLLLAGIGLGVYFFFFHDDDSDSDKSKRASLTSSLTLSRSVEPGPFDNDEVLDNHITFECDVVFPTSIDEDVMLFNHGATGRGTWVGILKPQTEGAVPMFVGRAGDGSNEPGDGIARFTTSAKPFLDGKTHNVVVDVRVREPGRIRAFVDGELVAHGTSEANALQNEMFSGGSEPAYGSGGTTVHGKPNTAWPGYPDSLRSKLKIYDDGQLVPGTSSE